MKKLLLILSLSAGVVTANSQVVQNVNIYNAAGHSNPNALTVLGDRLYFGANDSTHAHELWSSNDNFTVAIVNDNNTNGDGVDPSARGAFGVIGDTLYYSGHNGAGGYRVFAYDGINTPYAINGGATADAPDDFTVYNNVLYYSGQVGLNRELVSFDPATGTYTQATGTTPGSVYYDGAVPFNGKIYYAGNTIPDGTELFAYDPATTNYGMVYNINPGSAHSTPADLKVFNNKLYFVASNDTNGYQLYGYDGANPPARLTGIPGTSGTTQFSYTFFNNNIYFGIITNVMPSPAAHALYKYDIAAGTTSIVKTILSTQPASISGLTVFNNRLYFSAKDSLQGEELWMYNGNSQPAVVADIRTGGAGSEPAELTVFKNHLYFSARNDQVGRELFRFSDAGLGVQNIRFTGDAKVYPNPAKDIVNIGLDLKQNEHLAISLTDISGRVVHSIPSQVYHAGKNTVEINLGQFSSGHYFCRITDQAGRLCAGGKIIKE